MNTFSRQGWPKQRPKGQADLHMHTRASDGKADVNLLLDFIARRRPTLDVIAITDHDTLSASLWAYERRDQYPFDIVPGVEVTTAMGHMLALWVTTPIPSGLDWCETAQAIHEAGGLAVLAHPFHIQLDFVRTHLHRYLFHPEVLVEAGIDALEVFNAGNLVPGCNSYAYHIAAKLGLGMLGNSDAHVPGAIGSGVTHFVGRSAADLRAAILQRQTVVKGTPWRIIDFLESLHLMMRLKGSKSLENTTSSPMVNP